MAPNEINHPFVSTLFWEARFGENKTLTENILKNDYCSIHDLLIVLAHFYQALDAYARYTKNNKIKVEGIAPVLKNIRLWYIHPEDSRFNNISTSCETVIEEISHVQKIFKEKKLAVPPLFFENTKAIVTLFQSQK